MGKRSSTQWMLDALASSERMGELPPEFVCGLRASLEAGISCEEITALMVLFAGIYEAGEKMTGPELIERAVHLSCMMNGDIRVCQSEVEQRRKNKEHRALLKKKKRKRWEW